MEIFDLRGKELNNAK